MERRLEEMERTGGGGGSIKCSFLWLAFLGTSQTVGRGMTFFFLKTGLESEVLEMDDSYLLFHC